MKLVSIPANPVPDNVVTGMIKTRDGVSLRFARWEPPAGRRGTVCILTGRTEWIEKYFETVRDLRARGFAVAILDWRGQGLSDRALSNRQKGYVRNFSDYDLDLEAFMREVVLPDCPPPIFAVGHSMGSTVLIRAAYRGHRWFDRIVLVAPMLAIAGSVNSMATAGMLMRIIAARRLRRHVRAGAPYRRDGRAPLRGQYPDHRPGALRPQCRHPPGRSPMLCASAARRWRWCDAAFRAMRTIGEPSYPARIRQPILIVGAGRDAIVSNSAIEDFATLLRAGSHLVVVGARHEILMERDHLRSQFWAAFDAFVPGTPLY